MAPEDRNRQIRRVLWVILGLNWFVAAGKIVIGLSADFASVTADGFHSLIDGSSNVLGLVAMTVATRPADEDHPYGHGKFEALASLAIGAMIGIGMLELGRMALHALLLDRHPTVTWEMAVVMVATLIINIGVTLYERREGTRLKSPLLLADARHTLSDVFVTSAVLASMACVWMGWSRADGVFALLILGFVMLVAYGIVKQAVGILSDTARLSPDEVCAAAKQISGVRACADVRSRGMEGSVYVDLKVSVDPLMTTLDAHEVADAVETRLMSVFPQVVDVVVHVEPDGASPRP
jgi:cation diffusion facilitator family transporter